MTDSESKPVRVQLSRKRGWRMPENTIKVDRTTGYGNPFKIGEVPGPAFYAFVDRPGQPVRNAAEAVLYFQRLLIKNIAMNDPTVDELVKLRGKNLACWCALGSPCHADVLLKFANADRGESARSRQ